MMKYLFTALFLSLTACSSFYPIGGAVLGGGLGSFGGPAGAAVGAGAGAATGQILAGDKELKEAKEEIKLLSTGDVNALVQKRLEEAKEGGFFDSVLEGVYSFVKLVLLGVVLWQVVPIAITWISHRKLKAQNGNSTKD